MKVPIISIIIPCYNQSEFLSELLDSILRQSFEKAEVLIINDGSLDSTETVALDYMKKDSRVKYHYKPNGGLSSARNVGIKYAKGEYFYFIDADDLVVSDFFEHISTVMCKTQTEVLQFGYSYLLNSNKKIFHSVKPSTQLNLPEIFSGCPGPVNSFIIKRSIVEKAGLFNETLKSVEDWDFWIRITKCKPITTVLPEILTIYRLHELSMSRNYLIMYQSYCKVAIAAPLFDPRVSKDQQLNRDYEFNSAPIIKKALLRFVALAVMQGKVDDACRLFVNETKKYEYNWKAKDFQEMNYYLTFRYRYDKTDLLWVFKEQYPLFLHFFKMLHLDEIVINKYLKNVFAYHLKMYNVKRFGFIGKFFNSLSYFPEAFNCEFISTIHS